MWAPNTKILSASLNGFAIEPITLVADLATYFDDILLLQRILIVGVSFVTHFTDLFDHFLLLNQ